jgi:hypothetical protein
MMSRRYTVVNTTHPTMCAPEWKVCDQITGRYSAPYLFEENAELTRDWLNDRDPSPEKGGGEAKLNT